MTSPASPDTNRRWWTLGAVCVATFMLLLDITVVNTALPAIQKDARLSAAAPGGSRRAVISEWRPHTIVAHHTASITGPSPHK